MSAIARNSSAVKSPSNVMKVRPRHHDARRIYVSRIFKMYAQDFAGASGTIHANAVLVGDWVQKFWDHPVHQTSPVAPPDVKRPECWRQTYPFLGELPPP